jgi:hypothetical protein
MSSTTSSGKLSKIKSNDAGVKVHADGGADELLVTLDDTQRTGNLVIAQVIGDEGLTVTTVSSAH